MHRQNGNSTENWNIAPTTRTQRETGDSTARKGREWQSGSRQPERCVICKSIANEFITRPYSLGRPPSDVFITRRENESRPQLPIKCTGSYESKSDRDSKGDRNREQTRAYKLNFEAVNLRNYICCVYLLAIADTHIYDGKIRNHRQFNDSTHTHIKDEKQFLWQLSS